MKLVRIKKELVKASFTLSDCDYDRVFDVGVVKFQMGLLPIFAIAFVNGYVFKIIW